MPIHHLIFSVLEIAVTAWPMYKLNLMIGLLAWRCCIVCKFGTKGLPPISFKIVTRKRKGAELLSFPRKFPRTCEVHAAVL